MGPWKNQIVDVSKDWLFTELNNKIEAINWKEAKNDAENFLRIHERHGLAVWGRDFFLATVKKFAEYLPPSSR